MGKAPLPVSQARAQIKKYFFREGFGRAMSHTSVGAKNEGFPLRRRRR
jgi:hypothetical protein